MKEKKWNRKQRYGAYYEDIMQNTWTENWNKYKRRIQILRKEIIALGNVPTKEVQLISTVNYFVKLVNLCTQFVDKGLLTFAPADKAVSASKFNDILVSIMARSKGISQYINKSESGKPVTLDNLYLGMFSKIPPEDITPNMSTITINGEVRQIQVNYASLSDWLNNRVLSLDGAPCRIKQQDLANVDKQLVNIIMQSIDDVLA